jgi:hypothetical protein
MAAESRGEPASSDPTESTLHLQYGEICKSHEAISQFRAKLLALLPIASGAGALVLLGPLSDARNLRFFLPLGLYGFVVTLGLFMYECRGMQVCHMLQDHAADLEAALRLRSDQGQFLNRSTAQLAGIVGAEGAAWMIYPAILVGWLYITGLDPRLGWWHRNRGWVLSVLFAVVVGWTWRRLYRNATNTKRARESAGTARG